MKTPSVHRFLLSFLVGCGFVATLTAFIACESDDTTDFSQYIKAEEPEEADTLIVTTNDTIYVSYDGATASVTGALAGEYSINDAHVTLSFTAKDYVTIVLSGSTTNGSLLVYREAAFGIVLDNVSITNPDGPAINNQCSKALYVICPEGTTSTLTDGTSYIARDIDQKGAFFSEGQVYFQGTGTLNANGNYKNAIASDDYIVIAEDITINATSEAGNGVKVNDGLFVSAGILTINVTADGARGIKCDARTEISGGNITITTKGDCLIEKENGVIDTTSCAGIKSDSLFTMSGGTLTITSTGDGGKGINCSQNVEFSGGTLNITTTGSNDEGKPKAVKSDTGIIVSGGSFRASVKKSWACDNGTDSDDPTARVTVKGTPATCILEKRSVIIEY